MQPREIIFVKGYDVLSFGKNVGKNISKILSGKYRQKIIDHGKKICYICT